MSDHVPNLFHAQLNQVYEPYFFEKDKLVQVLISLTQRKIMNDIQMRVLCHYDVALSFHRKLHEIANTKDRCIFYRELCI